VTCGTQKLERQVTFQKEYLQGRDDCSVAHKDGQINVKEIHVEYEGTEWMELVKAGVQ
jgi:hypothetical protein